jgi:hypothetical protein
MRRRFDRPLTPFAFGHAARSRAGGLSAGPDAATPMTFALHYTKALLSPFVQNSGKLLSACKIGRLRLAAPLE